MKIKMEPIGYVESAFKKQGDAPHQGLADFTNRGTLVLREDLMEAMLGLEDIDYIVVLWNFNQSDPEAYKERMSFEAPKRFEGTRGIFATRTPFRPNGIGVTTVKIDEIIGNRLKVRGVDMLDQTPILDIKPFRIKVKKEENNE